MNTSSLHLAAFHHLPSQSETKFAKIAKFAGGFEALWQRREARALTQLGVESKVASQLVKEMGDFNVEVLRDRLEAVHATVLAANDEAYPLLLKEISDPPPVLYVRGDVANLKNICLAIVGTRAISRYGKQAIERIVAPLAQTGITIVSGLALGVDACAHEATLTAGGKTIAVLGSGVDKLTPRHNAALGKRILEKGGTIVSEFPLGTEPTNYTFPIRNRIISGLSRGTLVVEAREKSGSLITAKLALEQNRETFAVPGDISRSTSDGTNGLIRSGEAKLVTRAEDILSELGLEASSIAIAEELGVLSFDSAQEEALYALLDREGKETDALIRESGLAARETTGTLTMLEMKRLAKNVGGGMWVRK